MSYAAKGKQAADLKGTGYGKVVANVNGGEMDVDADSPVLYGVEPGADPAAIVVERESAKSGIGPRKTKTMKKVVVVVVDVSSPSS